MQAKRLSLLALGASLALTIIVYWPGLSGGYVFDDFPNIVDNAELHITHSTLANWANAAWSSPASEFQRPLASLTFALNWFISGENPWPMKATNLAIHLLNGLLLYFMLREMFRAWNTRCGKTMIEDTAAQRLALIVAAGWLLLPINVMAVLYVVQRMESLCQVFVLAGLWAYLLGRRRMMSAVHQRDARTGFVIASSGLVFGTAIGLLSKESAVLLPVYAFLVEWVLFRFRQHAGNEEFPDHEPTTKTEMHGRSSASTAAVDKRIVWLFVFTLLLPAVLGLAWLLPRSLEPAAWDGRSFTLDERLLTEARVLVSYLRWIVLPDPFTLSVYHDEMPISKGLLTPPTTLPAILFLSSLIALAIWLRDRLPLVALGILWFFAAQLLTATFIPLELVYEHRNYFASIGALLTLFSLLAGLRRTITLPIIRGALVALLLMWFAGVTYLRAQDWSNPLRLALAEANRHPDSSRANYEAGRLLIIASDYQPGPALEKAKFYLRQAAAIPGASTLPEQAQIMIIDHDRHRDDQALWREMTAKLRNQPTTQEDISALISLTQCRAKLDCSFDISALQKAFEAALSRPAPIARLYAAYADFANDLLRDDKLAIQAMRQAVKRAPGETAYRVQLAHWLAINGMTQDAVREIDALRRMDSFGRLDAQIAELQQQAEQGAHSPVQ